MILPPTVSVLWFNARLLEEKVALICWKLFSLIICQNKEKHSPTKPERFPAIKDTQKYLVPNKMGGGRQKYLVPNKMRADKSI